MRKKLFTIALSAIMVIAMAVPVFAADIFDNKVLNSNDFNLENHGRIFQYVYEDSNHNFIVRDQLLNVYTSSLKAQPGDKITTWKKTRAATQIFHKMGLNINFASSEDRQSAKLIVPDTNFGLCINFYRSGTNPEVNLASILNNYLYDAAVFSNYVNGYYLLYMKGRAGYSTRYIAVSEGENTVASDGNGTSKKCRWLAGGDFFYDNDNTNDFLRNR